MNKAFRVERGRHFEWCCAEWPHILPRGRPTSVGQVKRLRYHTVLEARQKFVKLLCAPRCTNASRAWQEVAEFLTSSALATRTVAESYGLLLGNLN